MTFKVRIVRKYSPLAGTWYVIQLRLFWIWWTLPKVYENSVLAEQAIYDISIMLNNDITSSAVTKREIEA